MKKKLSYLTILFLFSVFFMGCRKYPENPLIEFNVGPNRTKLDGVVWNFVKVTVDGVDSTEQKRAADFKACTLFFEVDKDKGISWTSCLSGFTSGYSPWGGAEYPSKPGFRTFPIFIYPYINKDVDHVILKLYKHQLKFKVVHPATNKVYIYEYKQ